MDDAQRRLYVDVVDSGSLSKAAARHFVTPQSVSQHMRRLEAELGFDLLVRTAQGVCPTEAGCLFYEGCKQLDDQLERLLVRCREAAGSARATIRLGSSPTYSLALFSRCVPTFVRRNPQTRVEYVDVDEHPLEGLLTGEYDVLEGVEPGERAFGFEPLVATRRVCMVRPGNPLASREVVEPSDLVGMDVYVFSLRWSEGLRRYLDAVCPQVELHELPGASFDAALRTLDPARSVHLLPEQLAGRYESLIPVPFDADVRTQYGLIYLPASAAQLREFLACAREVFAQEQS